MLLKNNVVCGVSNGLLLRRLREVVFLLTGEQTLTLKDIDQRFERSR